MRRFSRGVFDFLAREAADELGPAFSHEEGHASESVRFEPHVGVQEGENLMPRELREREASCCLPHQPAGSGGAASSRTRESVAAMSRTSSPVRSVEWSSSTITSSSTCCEAGPIRHKRRCRAPRCVPGSERRFAALLALNRRSLAARGTGASSTGRAGQGPAAQARAIQARTITACFRVAGFVRRVELFAARARDLNRRQES